jgi:hypothetical protein
VVVLGRSIRESTTKNLYIEVVAKGVSGFRRLFWIRESSNQAGVRFGFISKDVYGGHMTFYKTGHSHVESKAGILTEFDYIIPSNVDNDFYIMDESVIYLSSSEQLKSLNAKNRESDRVILIDENSLGESVWVNLYLTKSNREDSALKEIFSIGLTKKKHLIKQEIIPLTHVAGYSLILMVAHDR